MNSKLSYIRQKSISEIIVIAIKISIISFFCVYFLSNFEPYYYGQDSYLYGLVSIGIVDGTFETKNDLLEDTGRHEFVPRQWVITNHNSAVPSSSIGLPVIGSISYFFFGYYGLFYLIPVLSIALLILSERIATKLFGSVAGLTSLLLLSSNLFIVRTGTDLLTGNISSLFLIIGFFFLIEFLRNPKYSSALIISTSLVISSLIRVNGLIFFPIELFVIIGYFIIKNYTLQKNFQKQNSLKKIQISKKSVNYFLILIFPWIIFLVFWFSYNAYYFGDPMTTYLDVRKNMDSALYFKTNYDSLFLPNTQSIENIKIFSQYLLPNPFSGARTLEANYEDVFGLHWLGLVPIIFFLSLSVFSIIKKIKRTEIILTLIFAGGIIWFFSVIGGNIDPNRGVAGRYMIPTFVFSSFLFGFVIQKIYDQQLFSKKNLLSIYKLIIIFLLLVFFIFAINFVPPVLEWLNSESKFKDPTQYIERYPIDKEGLTKNSVILNTMGSWVVDYDVVPFHPFLGHSLKGEIIKDEFPEESISLLKELLKNNVDVYTFKESSHTIERTYLKYLVDNHKLVLKDFSDSFCKFEKIPQEEILSDAICLK